MADAKISDNHESKPCGKYRFVFFQRPTSIENNSPGRRRDIQNAALVHQQFNTKTFISAFSKRFGSLARPVGP